ncbi:MAG: multiheme c-type cytochrome [Polyangiaceae bacterium]|jgi:hypothetical protein
MRDPGDGTAATADAMKTVWATGALVAMAGLGLASGCGHGNESAAQATQDAGALLDPAVCGDCHAEHYLQWSGSMHAYASQDPVFLAMNKRMQRENPSLGTFCLKCHAPMAVLAGKTTDGSNLSELGPEYLGVTCYFCHNIDSVDTAQPFNAGVTLANDTVMRGEVTKPVAISFHGAKYSPLHDETQPESAGLCGACHDIDSPAGGHIERTFAEWQASAFGNPDAGEGVTTCGASGCHMKQDLDTVIAVVPALGPLPKRTFHEHDFPAVDQAQKAQTPFPNEQQEQAAVQAKLTNGMQGALCVTQAGGIRVILDTVNLGHDFPSGAAQDRRLWAEVIAYDQSGNVLYQSGVVPSGMSPVDVTNDPDLWLLRDCMFDSQDNQVDMFWQGATTDGNELPPITAFLPNMAAYNSHKVRFFPRSGVPITNDGGATVMPAMVTFRLRLQPIGIDVLNDLASTGDLDAGLIATLPPPLDIPLGEGEPTLLTWTAAAAEDGGVMGYPDPNEGVPTTCVGSLPNPVLQFVAPTHTNPKCTP